MVKLRPYKRGGWEVDIRFRWPDGEEYRERVKAPVDSKSGALRWGQEREMHLFRTGKPRKEEKEEIPTLSEFFPRWLDGHARANQQKASSIESHLVVYRLHLAPHLGSSRLDAISYEDVQQLKAKLLRGEKKYKPGTVNKILNLLRSVLRTAAAWKILRFDDLPKVQLLKNPGRAVKFYDFDEYEHLVEVAAKLDPRLLLLVLLGGEAGLRRGEIVALEWTDLDLRRKQLTISRQQWDGPQGPVVDTPKGSDPRRIPLTERLFAALAAHRHPQGARVLYREDGRVVDAHVLRHWLKRAQRIAGFRAVGDVHILRHTFGSHLAMRGAPARAIQELMGHKSLQETQRYMHLSPAAAEAAIRLLGGGLETGVRKGENTRKIN
jgi:integrase